MAFRTAKASKSESVQIPRENRRVNFFEKKRNTFFLKFSKHKMLHKSLRNFGCPLLSISDVGRGASFKCQKTKRREYANPSRSYDNTVDSVPQSMNCIIRYVPHSLIPDGWDGELLWEICVKIFFRFFKIFQDFSRFSQIITGCHTILDCMAFGGWTHGGSLSLDVLIPGRDKLSIEGGIARNLKNLLKNQQTVRYRTQIEIRSLSVAFF